MKMELRRLTIQDDPEKDTEINRDAIRRISKAFNVLGARICYNRQKDYILEKRKMTARLKVNQV